MVPIEIATMGVMRITDFRSGRHLTYRGGRTSAVEADVRTRGRFTVWAGENSITKSFDRTRHVNARGRGSDGSHMCEHGSLA